MGGEVAEPPDVGSDPAAHVQDPAILQLDVAPDQLEPALLSGAPHIARFAQPRCVGRWRSLDVLHGGQRRTPPILPGHLMVADATARLIQGPAGGADEAGAYCP